MRIIAAIFSSVGGLGISCGGILTVDDAGVMAVTKSQYKGKRLMRATPVNMIRTRT
jgi:hypothetical protein